MPADAAGPGGSTLAAELRVLAADLARRAGRLLLRTRPTGQMLKSSPTDLATDADRAAEALIVEGIRAARPGDSLLAEEGSLHEGTSGCRWVIDPLDGTVNFVYGFPMFSVSIGVDGALRAGAVYDPSRDELFIDGPPDAVPGGAVTCRPSAETELGRALVATGFSYLTEVRARQGETFRRVIPQVRDIRRGGSLALDLAWVACGRLDALYESNIKPWDISAGMAIVEAAGGTVWNEGDRIIAAGNQALLEALAAVVQADG